MATSVLILPYLSPRLVIVPAPETDITVQELVNLCRDWEDDEGLSYYSIITATGKDVLGGNVFVGITATLQNAKLAFEARTTPKEIGAATTNDTEGLILEDFLATFQANGVAVGATVINYTTGASATVTEIVDETHIRHNVLSGGLRTDWQISDEYGVYNIVQCNVTGGNLVAVDANQNTIDPISPTAFTQIVRTSSSSATLQELSDIQYASFNEGITVDIFSIYSGTSYPVGTQREPVNNLTDALSIAAIRGFDKLYILGNITVDAGLDYTGFHFYGESQTKSIITVSSAAIVSNCEFHQTTLIGYFDGNVRITDCTLNGLDFVSGIVKDSILDTGTIILGGAAPTHFLNCWSGVSGSDTPIIDCGGSGQAVAIRGYNGGIELRNKVGADPISIDMNSGQVVLDSTVTNGLIIVRGVGKLTDNSTGTAVVDAAHLIRPQSIRDSMGVAATDGNPAMDDVDGALSLQAAMKVILASVAGKAVVAPDGLSVQLYAEDGITLLRTLSVSSDQKDRAVV